MAVSDTLSRQAKQCPFIRLNERDNVAVAGADIPAGTSLDVDSIVLTIRHDTPRAHKFALMDIPSGGYVVKYGEIIGQATGPIQAGDHVHLHNLASLRGSPESKGER